MKSRGDSITVEFKFYRFGLKTKRGSVGFGQKGVFEDVVSITVECRIE